MCLWRSNNSPGGEDPLLSRRQHFHFSTPPAVRDFLQNSSLALLWGIVCCSSPGRLNTCGCSYNWEKKGEKIQTSMAKTSIHNTHFSSTLPIGPGPARRSPLAFTNAPHAKRKTTISRSFERGKGTAANPCMWRLSFPPAAVSRVSARGENSLGREGRPRDHGGYYNYSFLQCNKSRHLLLINEPVSFRTAPFPRFREGAEIARNSIRKNKGISEFPPLRDHE